MVERKRGKKGGEDKNGVCNHNNRWKLGWTENGPGGLRLVFGVATNCYYTRMARTRKRRREDCPILRWPAGHLYRPPDCPCQATLTRIQLSACGGTFGSGAYSRFGCDAAQSLSLDGLP